MARIAVYDKFYGSEKLSHADIAGQALAGSAHNVIGVATNIREAARQIISFADMGIAEQPDIVVMGGMLHGESDYLENPFTVTELCKVRRRTWSGVGEKAGKRTIFLLPQFEEDRITYRFPSIVTVGDASEDPPPELLRQWSTGVAGGVAARVLSRIVETYLPHAGRLGVSVAPMSNAGLSAEGVDRYDLDAVQQLRGHIQQLTGEG